jgi:hypothetical protein
VTEEPSQAGIERLESGDPSRDLVASLADQAW